MTNAGIYIRTSSEKQAERISPDIQEEDCRAYCLSRGYTVVEVYRDTERYRVGKRMVEPSGTRNDRPQFRRMITDIKSSRIEMVVAWREDRLYRSSRPMLDLLDAIKEFKANIELVKETFDATIAPVKAWAASMELNAKHDRFMMGVTGRYRRGMEWNQQPPYGYTRAEGHLVENPGEAKWVRYIFEHYALGSSAIQIGRELTAIGAQQRYSKHNWAQARVHQVLEHEFYWTGVIERKWGEETFQIEIPALVDVTLGQEVQKRKAAYQSYPAGNLKHETLCAGLLWCKACGTRMGLRQGYSDGKPSRLYYFCYSYNARTQADGCACNVSVSTIDKAVWAKVAGIIENPEEIESAVGRRIANLEVEQGRNADEIARLEQELSAIGVERQRCITWAAKGTITEADLDAQLAVFTTRETGIKADIRRAGLVSPGEIESLQKAAADIRRMVDIGQRAVRANIGGAALAEFKQKVTKLLVTRVEIDHEKKPYVQLVTDDINTLLASSRLADLIKWM